MGKSVSSFFIVLILIALGAGGYLLFKDLKGPNIVLSPETKGRISPAQDLSLALADASGVRSILVSVRRGAQSMQIFQQAFAPGDNTQKVTFNLKKAKLPEGAFELEVKAYDRSMAAFGHGNSNTISIPLVMDSQPPRIAVKTMPPAVRRGGSAMISYTVSEEVRSTGIQVGSLFFPAYAQANGTYACLFPFPYYESSTSFSPEIMAQDTAGNITSSRLLVNAIARAFREDTMKIDTGFLTAKSEELALICPDEKDDLSRYICANTKVRLENDAFLLELGKQSAGSFLWQGTFQRLPRSAVKANFGDHRTYMHETQVIDKQNHTGLDLASVKNAEVPATSKGKVVHTGYLGIYGNVVILDHGMGLMSLYSHLSSMDVNVGDSVESGVTIGRTGVSGLAGGDHVHFGFLVGGVPVQPLEWLDPAWIKNNITSRM